MMIYFYFAVLTTDGQYIKFSFNTKGEYNRDMCTQFLDLVSDRANDD